jgi:membrane protease YdiL (CAAX protease family)
MIAPSSNAPAPASAGPGGSQEMSYIFMIGSEILLATWIWAGVQWQGGRIKDLIGGRWSSWRQVLRDFAVALPFWVIWEATARLVYALLYPHSSPSNAYQVPTGAAEIFLWLLVSLAAGFCEELVFRGYLQRQFHAATGSIAAAVVLQAIVFGLVHSYQGWKPVLVITVLGVLYGTLVALRRDLRASMIAHVWSDIYEGYAKFLWLGRP